MYLNWPGDLLFSVEDYLTLFCSYAFLPATTLVPHSKLFRDRQSQGPGTLSWMLDLGALVSYNTSDDRRLLKRYSLGTFVSPTILIYKCLSWRSLLLSVYCQSSYWFGLPKGDTHTAASFQQGTIHYEKEPDTHQII